MYKRGWECMFFRKIWWKKGEQDDRITLWASICSLSSDTRVKSQNILSLRNWRNVSSRYSGKFCHCKEYTSGFTIPGPTERWQFAGPFKTNKTFTCHFIVNSVQNLLEKIIYLTWTNSLLCNVLSINIIWYGCFCIFVFVFEWEDAWNFLHINKGALKDCKGPTFVLLSYLQTHITVR